MCVCLYVFIGCFSLGTGVGMGQASCSIGEWHVFAVPSAGVHADKITTIGLRQTFNDCLADCCSLGRDVCQYAWLFQDKCFAVACGEGRKENGCRYKHQPEYISTYVKVLYEPNAHTQTVPTVDSTQPSETIATTKEEEDPGNYDTPLATTTVVPRPGTDKGEDDPILNMTNEPTFQTGQVVMPEAENDTTGRRIGVGSDIDDGDDESFTNSSTSNTNTDGSMESTSGLPTHGSKTDNMSAGGRGNSDAQPKCKGCVVHDSDVCFSVVNN